MDTQGKFMQGTALIIPRRWLCEGCVEQITKVTDATALFPNDIQNSKITHTPQRMRNDVPITHCLHTSIDECFCRTKMKPVDVAIEYENFPHVFDMRGN